MSSRARAISAATASAVLAFALTGCVPKLDAVPPSARAVVCEVTPPTPAHDVAVAPHDRAGRAYVDDTIEVRVAVCGDPRPKARPETAPASEPVG